MMPVAAYRVVCRVSVGLGQVGSSGVQWGQKEYMLVMTILFSWGLGEKVSSVG